MIRPIQTAATTAIVLGGLLFATQSRAHGADAEAGRVTRLGQILGRTTLTAEGQTLGNVTDLVIDAATGKVRYAALDAGGQFGLGKKMFAVPWKNLRFGSQNDVPIFLLDVEFETLRNAPGFDPEHWPNFVQDDWAKDIDRFFADPRKEGEIVRFAGRELMLRLAETGEVARYVVSDSVIVRHLQRVAELDDLAPGQSVNVKLENRDDQTVVTEIEILKFPNER